MSETSTVEQAMEEARVAWPGVALAPDVFREWVARRPGAVHLVDLYLACACVRGEARAVAAFQARFGPEVAVALTGQHASAELLDEVRQVLWTRLLVPRDGGAPKLAGYSGRGPLAKWVRVAATRTALNLRASGPPEVLESDRELEQRLPPAADPERAMLQARYQGEFQAALEAAIADLTVQERNVLRLHFLDGLGIDAIGDLYRIHRATAARWIARGRERLLEATRLRLRERLRVEEAELDSLMRLVRSKLDLSLRGLLLPEPG
jgi:RNA polymerase sigma-70 factor (ECF subfamily)